MLLTKQEIKLWLHRIAVPCLFLVVGFGLGLTVNRTLAPTGRFVTTNTDEVALDSKTGQYCLSLSVENKELPSCLDLYRKY